MELSDEVKNSRIFCLMTTSELDVSTLSSISVVSRCCWLMMYAEGSGDDVIFWQKLWGWSLNIKISKLLEWWKIRQIFGLLSLVPYLLHKTTPFQSICVVSRCCRLIQYIEEVEVDVLLWEGQWGWWFSWKIRKFLEWWKNRQIPYILLLVTCKVDQ